MLLLQSDCSRFTSHLGNILFLEAPIFSDLLTWFAVNITFA